MATSTEALTSRWPAPLSAEEQERLLLVADSGCWTDGPWTAEVERQLSALTGAPYAVAFNSCTSAIHAAAIALDVRAWSCVAAPALTFAGTVTGVGHMRAALLFTDVDPETLTISEAPAEADLIIAVDLHGVPHGLNRRELAGRPVLTDACQSLGTTIGGRHIGREGTHAWSFSSAKLVTAPDGGAITTESGELAAKLRELRDYGTADSGAEGRANMPVLWRGGHNWRPSEFSMALVASRLPRLDELVDRARQAAEYLHHTIDAAGLWRQTAPPATAPAWHKIRLGPRGWSPAAGMTGGRLAELERQLAAAGVLTHWWGRWPLHTHPAYSLAIPKRLPVAEAAAAGSLCLGTERSPYWIWSDSEVERVADAIGKPAHAC